MMHKVFEFTSYDEISVIGIPEFFNIVSCYGYVQEDTPTVILACRINFLSYYLFNGFVIIQQDYQSMKNIPVRVKKHIHVVDIH